MHDPELAAYEHRQAQIERDRFRDRVALAAMRELVYAATKTNNEFISEDRAGKIARSCYLLADKMAVVREDRSDGE